MGSKISKAVRRPQATHPLQTTALIHHESPCQVSFLPPIVPEPLVIDAPPSPRLSTLTCALDTADAANTPDSSPADHAGDAEVMSQLPFANEEILTPTSSPPPPEKVEVNCQICAESFLETQECETWLRPCRQCRLPWCTDCLKSRFVRACADMTSMPPRCCPGYRLNLHIVKPYLTNEEAAQFREKYQEWSTPNPVYCPVPICSAFISPHLYIHEPSTKDKSSRVDSVVGTPATPSFACPKCDSDICAKCHQLVHLDTPCHSTEFGGLDEQTAKLLKKWGYKRCPKCGNGVRRMFGCNHMQCLCGAQWCYVCRQPYEECEGGCGEEEDEDEDEDEEGSGSEAGEDEEDESSGSGLDMVGTPPLEEQEELVLDRPSTSPPEADIEANAPDEAATSDTPTRDSRAPPRHERVRNLDAGHHWGEAGFNFGEEPEESPPDAAWNCTHNFAIATVDASIALRAPATTDMECTNCWRKVHPEIAFPERVKATRKVVAGVSHSRTGSIMSGVFPSAHDLAINLEHNDGPFDMYGRPITEAETAGRKRRFSAGDEHDRQPAMRVSLAHQCSWCDLLVCVTCKDEIKKKQDSAE